MARNQYDADLDLVPENSSKSYKMGTLTDQRDMRRVGKTQELRVSRDLNVYIADKMCCSC